MVYIPLDFLYIMDMNLTKEDIEIIKNHIAEVFPALGEPSKDPGLGTSYPYNMARLCWNLEVPEKNDTWELIRIYKDNTVHLDRTLYRGKYFRCASSWTVVPLYKKHSDLPKILKYITRMATQYKQFKEEYKLKEIQHDF